MLHRLSTLSRLATLSFPLALTACGPQTGDLATTAESATTSATDPDTGVPTSDGGTDPDTGTPSTGDDPPQSQQSCRLDR